MIHLGQYLDFTPISTIVQSEKSTMLANPVSMNSDLGRPILDKDNIINVRDGESLYRQCIKLRRRLSGVPGFRPFLSDMEQREQEGADPVSSLWQCFRSGMPLLTIYNASNPEEGDLHINTNLPEKKWGKEAAFLFIKSCMQQMKIPTQDTFTVSELYSDNTTGFIKVIKLVDRVLDILQLSGKLHPSTDSEDSRDGTDSTASSTDKPPKSMTRRQHILKELVETERQYVHHLQNLQSLKKELEEVGALKGDSIHDIFLNLNNILDFAQRFLIRVEQQNELPDSQQNWGAMFIHYKDPFRQYEPFIANQRRCEITCQREWDKMVATSRASISRQMLANPSILNGFLLKPFQRLTKYPLLLKDLQKQTEDPILKNDLDGAIHVIQDVLNQADLTLDKESRDDALQDLQERIDDWKTLQLQTFGELLLLGTFNVMKEGSIRSEEKEYHIYLFHRILIMCKDVNAQKSKNKMSSRPAVSLRGKPRMNLKGRIYLTNVTNITPSSSPGNYSLQISWKGEPTSVETFVIKFKNDETLRKWQNTVEIQRTSCLVEAKGRGTSDTQLHSLAGMQMENPYAANYDEDDDVPRFSNYSGSTYVGSMGGAHYSEFSMSRNASSTSLRSRSATGGSGGSTNPHLSQGRRVPTGDMGALPPLNTRVPLQPGGEYQGESYFSPIDRDTPPGSASTRSSAQSAFPGYHRGQPSMTGLPPGVENYRNTAPAMPRNVQGNPYLARQAPGQRPSLPPNAAQSAHMNRMRSASSPDIHPNVQSSRKYTSGEGIPNVPPIPSYVTNQMPGPNRSQNNSPNNGGPFPIRTTTPMQYAAYPGPRPLLPSHNYTYDQSYNQDPRKPGHAPSLSTGRPLSPIPAADPADSDNYMPSQLKAKVCYEDNYVSMIIPSNIHFRSLTDRIDAKLSRFTNHSIASGSVRLRYRDEDGDFILIDSDEGVHEALLDWRDAHLESGGQNNELLLFAQATGADEGVAD